MRTILISYPIDVVFVLIFFKVLQSLGCTASLTQELGAASNGVLCRDRKVCYAVSRS